MIKLIFFEPVKSEKVNLLKESGEIDKLGMGMVKQSGKTGGIIYGPRGIPPTSKSNVLLE